MSSNSFGTLFRVTTFGESHGKNLGAVVDGVPAGLSLSEEMIERDLRLRRPGQGEFSTSRQETDRVSLVSGVFEGVTLGTPIAMLFENRDVKSKDYERLRDLYRPGHADWTYDQKYGVRDWRGGGRSSGRETVARVAAGAIARAVLAQEGIAVTGATRAIAGIVADLEKCDWSESQKSPLRCPDRTAAAEMEQAIREAKGAGDSVGGVVEVRATGVPVGLGEPVFDKLDARLAGALMSIGAVKGVEVGDGFGLAKLRGSQANDPLLPGGKFAQNRAGGILGGISSGAEIVLRVAVKPTPSIQKEQMTIDTRGRPVKIEVTGRHDPCIVPRLVAVAEAMTMLTLADALLIHRSRAAFLSIKG